MKKMDDNNKETEKKTGLVKKEDDHIPVYDVEIIDPPPSGKIAYKLGKAAGSVIAVIGFINEIRKVFRGVSSSGSGKSKPEGKGMRRKRKMRRSG